MTTVLTARQLQDAYMQGGGVTATINRQEFEQSYGRYAIYAAAKAFQNTFGGDISAAPATGELIVIVNMAVIAEVKT